MRVLLVAHALPPATYGGTELYTCDLADALAGRGHGVGVAAPRGADDPPPEIERDVATFELPGPGGETAPGAGGRPLDAVTRPALDDRFRDVLADFDPDAVHCQHLKHLSATLPSICDRREVACVLTLHDFWTVCHREQLYRPEGRPCAGPESVGKCADCYRRAKRRSGDESAGESPVGSAVESAGESPVGSAVESAGESPVGSAVESAGGRATVGGAPAVDTETSVVDAPEASAEGDGGTRSAVARRNRRLRRALDAADRLVAPSAFLREAMAAFGVPEGKLVHRRNGVRVDRFATAGFDPEGPLRVGYAGRITERKGVHLLVGAVRRVARARAGDPPDDGPWDESDPLHDSAVDTRDIELHVFGRVDPADDEYHARLVGAAGAETTFHGRYADRPDPYRGIDVLVLPSVWYENSPMVIQEAFAAGVPVVTADVGGMAELVTHGEDGLTFPVGDAGALADALARLAADPGLVADLRAGVSDPKRLATHAREVADLYAEVVEDGVGREDAGSLENAESREDAEVVDDTQEREDAGPSRRER